MRDATVYYIAGACAIVLLVIMAICSRNCCRRRSIRKQTVYVLPIQEPHNPRRDVDLVRNTGGSFPDKERRKSTYLVPLSALPNNFNYSSPNVEVKHDHVVISDLSLIQTASSAIPTSPIYVPPEVQKQAPYNPNYGYMI